MKRKGILPVLLPLLILFFSGCFSGFEEEKISIPDPPTDITYEGESFIDGPLSDYLEVVPGGYVLELEKKEESYRLGYSGSILVKFRFLESVDIEAGSGYNRYGPSLLGEVLDERGVPQKFSLEINADQTLARYLKRGFGEEWLTLTLLKQGRCETAEDAIQQLEKFKKGKKIRFNSEIIQEKMDPNKVSTASSGNPGLEEGNVEETEENYDDEDSYEYADDYEKYSEDSEDYAQEYDEEETMDSESDEDEDVSAACDKFFKGYEKFVDQYLAIIKRMKNNPNDLTVMTEYSKMMNEATDWTDKIENCSDDPQLAARYAKLQLKLTNAISEF